MPTSIYNRGLLKPGEIAKLQRVFDVACTTRAVMPHSAAARDVALTILALHNAGMVDEDLLLDAVAFDRSHIKAG